jgi:hypothetical protein
MKANGFKLQPFQSPAYENSFLKSKPLETGNFRVNGQIKNKFLTQPSPTFSKGMGATSGTSYLRKTAQIQSDPSIKKFMPMSQPDIGFTNPEVTGLPDDGKDKLTQEKPAINKFSAINAGLGLFGLAKAATAKVPTVQPTPEYNALIRPFSGDAEGKAAKDDAINRAAYQATNDLKTNSGASSTAYLTGRTQVQANVTQARNQAISEDSQIRRIDRDRFDQQKEEENRINYTNSVNDKNNADALAYEQYRNRTTSGGAMAQKALDFAQNQQVDSENKKVALKQVEDRMKSIKDAGRYSILYSAISRGGLESLTPELRAAYDELMGIVPVGKNGMKISYLKKESKTNPTAEKMLADANQNLKSVMVKYSEFVSKASNSQMNNFQKYVRQINQVNRIKIRKN